MFNILLLVGLLTFSICLNGQKVGLVLSGGGSGGVSHIGVLKALEENNIPIDYITGTSMGALVGGFYAAGYSPEEIEAIFLSGQFKNWAEGVLDEKYVYSLREKDENPSLITLKIDLGKLLETSLPTNLISPIAIDYGLMRYFAPSTALAKENFDSLFVPFRCVASDIISKETFVLKKGKLGTAIRSSMAYPFYLTPVSYDGKLLFDGGLYNNFPSDIMYNDFLPDYIIGSNVSSNFEVPNEDNIMSQIKTIVSDETEYSISCDNSIIIEPEASDFSLFNFDENEKLIKRGYDAAIKNIETIKNNVNRRSNKSELKEKRQKYIAELPELLFSKIDVEGMTASQNTYVRKSLRYKDTVVSALDLKSEYIKVSSDDKIKKIYPQAEFNPETNKFTLKLNAKKEKDLFVSFGGAFSSRPINTGYLGLQYNFLGKTAISILANTYFGKLHNSVSTGFRLDFPFRLPFYWKTIFTIDGWDYFKSSSTLFEDTKSSFLVNNDQYFRTELAFPIAYKGKIVFDGSLGEINNKYYQTKNFLSIDTTDKTTFRNFSLGAHFDRNSLDMKQYASKGSSLSFGIRYINGDENTIPGSTSIIKDEFDTTLAWIQLKFKYDKYFSLAKNVRLGFQLEGVQSNQPFFNNYAATVLSAPAFEPLSESKTLFQENFRAHSYFAIGVKNVYQIFKNVQLRFEGYLFQPHQQILKNELNRAYYGEVWADREFVFGSSLVYTSPLGPLAINLNYYDKVEDNWSFMIHFGYVIFNKKSLE